MASSQPKYKLDPSKAKLHISKGNAKIGKGIYSFSTLPGNAEHMLTLRDGTLLTDVPGTCSRFCDGCAKDGACYAWRDAKLHSNATIPAWGDNTILLRSGRLWDELETFLTLKNAKAIKLLRSWKLPETDDLNAINASAGEALRQAHELAAVKTFRIHVSGELESADDLRRWNAIALRHPETVFGIYTKNYDALGEYLDGGVDFASNLVVNVSQWHRVADAFLERYSWAKLNVFEYDDSLRKDCGLSDAEKDRLAGISHCPAVDKDGKHRTTPAGDPITCDMCGRCYVRTGRRTAVYAH